MWLPEFIGPAREDVARPGAEKPDHDPAASIPESRANPAEIHAQASQSPEANAREVDTRNQPELRKGIDLDLPKYLDQKTTGKSFSGNFLHFLTLDLGHACRPDYRFMETRIKAHIHSAPAIHSMNWAANYQRKYCAEFYPQPDGFSSWMTADSELWNAVGLQKEIFNHNWFREYTDVFPDVHAKREHMYVMQPSYAFLKEAEAAILYATDVARIELGLLVYGDYHPALGDPLNVPISSDEFPAIRDRFSMRQMELAGMVLYCRFRPGECGPEGFYSFIQCRERYLCSDTFTVFGLMRDRYHPRELAFANTFVDDILRQRQLLGSAKPH
jgi:hypothetical protein